MVPPAKSTNSILNRSGFLPGDVLFVTRRGGTTAVNLAAQNLKRWMQRTREPYVGYAHVALAIGQDQVVHSTVSAKGSNQPHGVTVQSVYEMTPDSSTRWEVLRSQAGNTALESVRDVSLAYVGFAYNDRFDLKQLLRSVRYDFAVYCSEFIAAVFSELELFDRDLVPHKVTPNLLHDTLVRGGWAKVPVETLTFNATPEWTQISVQHAAIQFAAAKHIVSQTLSTSGLLVAFLDANRALIDLDKDGSLTLQEYFRLGSRNLISLPVTFRARLAMSQLETMAFDEDDVVSTAAGLETSASDTTQPMYRLKRWAELALRAQQLQSYSRMVDHYFAFEAHVAAELVAHVRVTLQESKSADATRRALENLYQSSSALCHYFQISDVIPLLTHLAERFQTSGATSVFVPAFNFLTLVLAFYLCVERLLLKSGSVVLGRLDVTPEIVACLKELASAYERLEPHITIRERDDKIVVSVDAVVLTTQAAEVMMRELRKALTAAGVGNREV